MQPIHCSPGERQISKLFYTRKVSALLTTETICVPLSAVLHRNKNPALCRVLIANASIPGNAVWLQLTTSYVLCWLFLIYDRTCNRTGHIFSSCGFFFLSFFRLIPAVGDWMSTILRLSTHGVALACEFRMQV